MSKRGFYNDACLHDMRLNISLTQDEMYEGFLEANPSPSRTGLKAAEDPWILEKRNRHHKELLMLLGYPPTVPKLIPSAPHPKCKRNCSGVQTAATVNSTCNEKDSRPIPPLVRT
ncbi:hypothetical protein PAAG_11437 [Paracoccidioides lutzii Pb01]|uniref:Uncharacterized protein n=1 Tax=Paracoccidioides lutzii (strain ATCC MYA-826 / Pb01) TaxID=502779 RepID=A0A0A2V234_PARBA|nr:hypothetical protein PAAG_11437 [Paracoccidioides lutzii Pb01]KGQ01861.1 hypothetical protein PAAG_11437 [Paracoccidioides lutzii Pb01]